MAGPWEAYQQAPSDGPWSAYQSDEPKKPTRSTGDEIARQVALTGRYLGEGILGIGNMVGDSANTAINYATRGINAVAGTDIPRLGLPSQETSRLLTAAGAPEPQTPTERVVGDISKAMASAGSVAGAAGGVAGPMAEKLAANAGAQMAAAGVGGGSAGTAREMGANPMTQLVIGLATGFATPAALEFAGMTAGAATRAAQQVAKPFTAKGREDVVGAALNRMASDKTAAVDNMAGADEIIPGSQPTTAQASKDIGLIQTERALASVDPKFAARKSANNTARNVALDDIAKTPEDLAAAKTARSDEASGLYEKAFTEPLRPDAPIQPLLDLSKRPSFQSAVRKAADLAAENGENVEDVMTSTKGLHYIKLALDDMLDTAPQSGIGKSQQRAIASTRENLLNFLDDASPSYAAARQGYRDASQPVNQMETGQLIQKQTRLAGPDVTGEPIISQAKWQNAVTNKLGELGKNLKPEQVDTLKAIGADLDRAVVSDTAGKAAGSNTFQNLSTANLLGAALGNKLANNAIAQTAALPFKFIYQIPEAQVKDLLVQAMLDPTLARTLMAKASRPNIDFLAASLKFKARAMGLGAAEGAATAGNE